MTDDTAREPTANRDAELLKRIHECIFKYADIFGEEQAVEQVEHDLSKLLDVLDRTREQLAERDRRLAEIKEVCANAVALSSGFSAKYVWLIGHLNRILLDE